MTRTQIVENRSQIAIYLPSLRGGGAEKVMVTLANGFAAYGYGVDLVLARAEGPYLADVSDKVRIIDLNASRVFFSLPALVRYLRRERPRALLSALNHANVIAVAARALARSATRLVVSEHNNPTIAARAERSAAGRAVHAAMRWTYPRADGVVAVSAGVADDLARWAALPRSRIEVIYNSVVTPALVARAAESPAHPWFGDGGPPVVVGVGRLTAQKDFATLLRASPCCAPIGPAGWPSSARATNAPRSRRWSPNSDCRTRWRCPASSTTPMRGCAAPRSSCCRRRGRDCPPC